MRTFFSHFDMTKAQRSGFFILLILIGLAQILIFYLKLYNKQEEAEPLSEEILQWQAAIDEQARKETATLPQTLDLSPFNPNALTEQGWMKLGFSEKQAISLIKYKYSLGGNFTSLEQLKEAYVISDQKFEELKPYIKLQPVKNQSSQSYNSYSTAYPKKKKIHYRPFDPNAYSESDWMKIGFTQKQAATILKYKNKILKGEFKTLDEINQCYVISDEKFQELKPYIRISKSSPVVTKLTFPINPNDLSVEEWAQLGFDEATAKNIVKYKEFIGGEFQNLEDLKKCQFIPESKLDELKNKLVF